MFVRIQILDCGNTVFGASVCRLLGVGFALDIYPSNNIKLQCSRCFEEGTLPNNIESAIIENISRLQQPLNTPVLQRTVSYNTHSWAPSGPIYLVGHSTFAWYGARGCGLSAGAGPQRSTHDVPG